MAEEFKNQVNALFRKSLSYQKHHVASNVRLVLIPIVVFAIIGIGQFNETKESKKDKEDESFNATAEINPPLLQVPSPGDRAVKSKSIIPFTDLPDESCKMDRSCPAIILLTGQNRTLAQDITSKMISTSSIPANSSGDFPDNISLAIGIFGTDANTGSYFSQSAQVPEKYPFFEPEIYHVQPHCPNLQTAYQDVKCLEVLPLWRKSYSEINDELYKGYHNGNPESKTNEILGVYDFQNTSDEKFSVVIGYNGSYKVDQNSKARSARVVRVQKAENMIANGYLQYLRGPSTRIVLESVVEMPGGINKRRYDNYDMILLPTYIWMIFQLFPVVLQTLVYERQNKLQMMMKMHGLGHGAYWVINYMYFLLISTIYICSFLLAGTLTGLKLFIMNSKLVLFIFLFVHINLQISLGFLLSLAFKSMKTASVVGFLMVFVGVLIGPFFMGWVAERSFFRIVGIIFELYPGFALSRGILELNEYAIGGMAAGTFGFQWRDLKDGNNIITELLLVMTVTWLVFLVIGFWIDKYSSSTSLFSCFRKSGNEDMSFPQSQNVTSGELRIQMEKEDIAQEIELVQKLRIEPDTSYAAVCYNLKKVYRGTDGNPDICAVGGVNLAFSRGECFGILGPNGAGKTTLVNVLAGLLDPTSGTASVEEFDLRREMNMIHTIMGVCPQYDSLWDILTAREHLNFYGRLKNFKGPALRKTVDDCLDSVGLLEDADKKAGQFSGGMRRRLSVAISLVGNPKVVYLDEPSTGLDPASRKKVWAILHKQRRSKTIILTTHSMEEAERLCDRIGIFADGKFLCLGRPDGLKDQFSGEYILSVTTHPDNAEDVNNSLKHLTPRFRRTYIVEGTQLFELPTKDVKKSQIFEFIRTIREKYPVLTWDVSETTLEEVFYKVVTEEED